MNFGLRAAPESPLHLANRLSAGNYSSTMDYIPGTALRGALAVAYLSRPDLQRQVSERLQPTRWSFDNYFKWLFLSDMVRFPDLYPQQGKPSFVIPISARSCKRYKGFVDDINSSIGPSHGVFDALLYEPGWFRCPARRNADAKCDAPMEYFSGFYESDDATTRAALSIKAARRVLTRTAIEYSTGMVRQGALYSLESIEEGGGGYTIFAGLLKADAPGDLPPQNQRLLLSLLQEHLKGALAILQIGAAKTRGLGRVRLEVFDTPDSGLTPLEERFDRLQMVWGQTPRGAAGDTVFTLTLNSDAIIIDELWRYCSVVDQEVLKRESPGAPACALQPPWFIATRIVSGWNSAHRLPKEDEMAISKGAAFLYTTTADRGDILAWLQRIEAEGIGERRNEGFGQVIACHPFHWGISI